MRRSPLLLLTLIMLPRLALGWSTPASQTASDMRQLELMVQTYHLEKGRYPDPKSWVIELEKYGLHFLSAEDSKVPVDHWGQPYVYKYPGTYGPYDLYSIGENGVLDEGKHDDISNWAGVNDGYYWKNSWPMGRMCIIVGILASIAPLFFYRKLGWKTTSQVSGMLLSAGIGMGCHLLMHPGVIPSRNIPLGVASGLMFTVFAALLFWFLYSFYIRSSKELK